MSKKNTPEPADEVGRAELENTQNLGKIREILFGNQTREYDQRFSGFEERIQRELTTIREENSRGLESLKTFVKNELESLSSGLSTIREEQGELEARMEKALNKSTAAISEKLSDELKETSQELSKKTRQLGERLDGVQRKLREEMLGQANDLRSEQQQASKSLTNDLSKEADRLNSAKISRTDLAALLSGVVMSLSEEGEE